MFPCRIENYKPCLLQILAEEPSNAWYVGELFGKPAWSNGEIAIQGTLPDTRKTSRVDMDRTTKVIGATRVITVVAVADAKTALFDNGQAINTIYYRLFCESFPGCYFLTDGEADHPIIVCGNRSTALRHGVCGNGERVGLIMGIGMRHAPKLADVLAEIDRAEVQL